MTVRVTTEWKGTIPMTELTETPMPGLGARWDMVTRSRRAVAVISHQTGRRDLVIYGQDDPDAAAASVELTTDEAQTLSELLGGSRIVERLDALAHQLHGLLIEWVTVSPASPLAGQTLADSQVRTRTGASILALIRDGQAIPSPGADDLIMAADTAVIVGDPAAVTKLTALFDATGPLSSK